MFLDHVLPEDRRKWMRSFNTPQRPKRLEFRVRIRRTDGEVAGSGLRPSSDNTGNTSRPWRDRTGFTNRKRMEENCANLVMS